MIFRRSFLRSLFLQVNKCSALVLYNSPQVSEGGLRFTGGAGNFEPPTNTGEIKKNILNKTIATGSGPIQRHHL